MTSDYFKKRRLTEESSAKWQKEWLQEAAAANRAIEVMDKKR